MAGMAVTMLHGRLVVTRQHCYAVSLVEPCATGILAWSVPLSIYRSISYTAPAFGEGLVFFGDDHGWLFAASLANGSVAWKMRVAADGTAAG